MRDFQKSVSQTECKKTKRPLDGAKENTDLLASLYGFLSDPDGFIHFFEKLDDELSRLDTNEHLSRLVVSSELEQIDHHFAFAAKIFDRIGLDLSDQLPSQLSQKQNSPQWIFNHAGKLVWQNIHARNREMLDLGATYHDLSEEPVFLDVCADELAQAGDRKEPLREPDLRIVVQNESSDQTSQRLFLIQRDTSTDANRCLSVSSCHLGWSEKVGLLLENSFGLSLAEQDILRGVVEGKQLSEIAEERGRSIQTIRTQSKSLLRKTGASSQVGLVRLFAAISLSIPHNSDHPANQGDRLTHLLRTRFIELPNEPPIQIDEYGSPAGHPVILFHGLFTGTGLTARASAFIAQSGLRVIAPWRPNWHRSEKAEWTPKDSPKKFAAILRQIIDHYEFEKVTLVGRFTGSIYALAAAQALGDRVQSTILLSSTPPIIDHTQLKAMSGWQKVFAYAITYTPSVVPILVRGMRQFLFRQETAKFLAGFYAKPSADVDARQDPALQQLIAEQVEKSFAQGTKGHEQDLMLTGSDWRDYSKNIFTPVLFIHGTENPVDPITEIEALVESMPSAELLPIERAGQLFVHVQPELVWGHIRRFIAKNKEGPTY